MPISSSDLQLYGSAHMPEDDLVSTVVGGAISTTTKLEFTDVSTPTTVSVFSSNPVDTTQTLTITGRDTSGNIVSQILSLSGTTIINSTQVFERILKIVLSAPATGTVSVVRNNPPTYTPIVSMLPGILQVRRTFYAASSGVLPATRYEKVFLKNTNGSFVLQNAKVTLTADPSSKLLLGLAAAKNDSTSITGRLNNPPPGVTFVGLGVDQFCPGNTLENSAYIGVWISQTLQANDPPVKSSGNVRILGTS